MPVGRAWPREGPDWTGASEPDRAGLPESPGDARPFHALPGGPQYPAHSSPVRFLPGFAGSRNRGDWVDGLPGDAVTSRQLADL